MQIQYIFVCILTLTKGQEETTENVSDTTNNETETTTVSTTTTTEDPITVACITDNTVRYNKIQLNRIFKIIFFKATYPIQTCNCHLDKCLSMIYDEFEEDSCPTCAQYTQPDTTTVFDYGVLFEGDPPTESTTIVVTTTTNIMEDGTTTVDSDMSITTTDSDTTVNTEDTTTKTMSTTVDPDTETTTVVETTTTSAVVETSTKTLLCNTTMSYGVFLAKNVSILKCIQLRYFLIF